MVDIQNTKFRSVLYHNYRIYENGAIYSPHGKRISPRFNKKGGYYEAGLRINGVVKTRSMQRWIYHAFNPNAFNIDNRNVCVVLLDGDKSHYYLSNLQHTDRKGVARQKEKNKNKIQNEQNKQIINEFKRTKNISHTAEKFNKTIDYVFDLVNNTTQQF